MRVAYVSRAEALKTIKNVAPEDLLQELLDRGVSSFPDVSLLRRTTECPHCGKKGAVSKDFGVRILGGKIRAQSWCRECRKNPDRLTQGRGNAKRVATNDEDMVSNLRESLLKAGVKAAQIRALQKAMNRS